MYNGKQAVRYGHSTCPNCPLCGEPDSQSHMLGGCKNVVLSGMYNNRHNVAVRKLVTSLRSIVPDVCFVQSGVGSLDEGRIPAAGESADPHLEVGDQPGDVTSDTDTDEGPDNPTDRLPAAIPAVLVDWGNARPRVPDLTWAEPRGLHAPPMVVHVVELKFGQDTKLERKAHEAKQILDSIAQAVQRAHNGCVARTHLLLLGVGGRVPSDTHTALTEMGLSTTAANRLCNSLNLHAVTSLASIVRTRRRLERGQTRAGVG